MRLDLVGSLLGNRFLLRFHGTQASTVGTRVGATDTTGLATSAWTPALVDVGGRRLAMQRDGRGGPPVVLLTGSGSVAMDWLLVHRGVAGFTTSIAYDRAGYGTSEPDPGRRPGRVVAAELHRLLDAADVPRPVILVGHSLGGLYVREFVRAHRDEVAGLVLVDAADEDVYRHVPRANLVGAWALVRVLAPLARAGILRLLVRPAKARPSRGVLGKLPFDLQPMRLELSIRPHLFVAMRREHAALEQTCMDLRRDRDLGALPTVVITASKPPWKGGDTYWREAQRRLAGLSSQTRQIVAADSGHAVPLEQPELVVAAIRELVDQVRSPTPCMHEDPL